MPELDAQELAARMSADLAAIEQLHMPFGKFGPAHFPPRGIPIYDLPVEYLEWFASRGTFPRGRLGEMLRVVHRMKVEGMDGVFDGMRARAGGKAALRAPRRRAEIRF
jgi:uncharacterized protein (DUF3820 family)